MAFLNDLDGAAWVATLAAIVVCGAFAFLNLRDWRNHWPVEYEGRLPIIGLLGMLFLFGAITAYSPNENAPRKTVEGIVHFVGKKQGRSSFTEFICATSCDLTGGYALALDENASRVTNVGSNYLFTYLERPTGDLYVGMSLQVIAISEVDSGRVLYAFDLTNHPYRIAVYLLDIVMLGFTGLLAGLLKRSQLRERSEESTSNDEEPKESESILL